MCCRFCKDVWTFKKIILVINLRQKRAKTVHKNRSAIFWILLTSILRTINDSNDKNCICRKYFSQNLPPPPPKSWLRLCQISSQNCSLLYFDHFIRHKCINIFNQTCFSDDALCRQNLSSLSFFHNCINTDAFKLTISVTFKKNIEIVTRKCVFSLKK